MKLSKTILFTNNHISGLILRLTLGLVILPHGLQLLLGWFGGYGFSGSMSYFTGAAGLPWIVAFLVIMLQSIGALLILPVQEQDLWHLLTLSCFWNDCNCTC